MQTASKGRLTTHVYMYVFIGLYQFNLSSSMSEGMSTGGVPRPGRRWDARPFTHREVVV